jgi:hypothetical protein
LTLGVHAQTDLDQAITAHGRILHDATVMSINVKPGGELGSVNWMDGNASSLSELSVQLSDALDRKLIDGQVATAFGANQQLVASEIEKPAPKEELAPVQMQEEKPASEPQVEAKVPPAPKPNDGTIEISHEESSAPPSPPQPAPTTPFTPQPVESLPPVTMPEPEPPVPDAPQIHIDREGRLRPLEDVLPPVFVMMMVHI